MSQTDATRSCSPEMVVLAGPLTAAIEIRSDQPAMTAATSSSDANTVAMEPVRDRVSISRARSTARRRPSSRPTAPATQAATYSPKLCPRTATGSTPHDRHNWASAYSTANRAGWA